MSLMNTREETCHMTDKKIARLIVAERLIEGEITIKDAAEVLGLSTRQVKKDQKESEVKWSKGNSSWQ
jgi:AraC-like DNA-binding protein